MILNEKSFDEIVNQLVRITIDIKRQTSFAQGSAELSSETQVGTILARYLKSGREIAETAYSALDAVGLTVEALLFSELWRRSNPDQNDLWITEKNDLNGKFEN